MCSDGGRLLRRLKSGDELKNFPIRFDEKLSCLSVGASVRPITRFPVKMGGSYDECPF